MPIYLRVEVDPDATPWRLAYALRDLLDRVDVPVELLYHGERFRVAAAESVRSIEARLRGAVEMAPNGMVVGPRRRGPTGWDEYNRDCGGG